MSNRNDIDATEAGAYAVGFATVERVLGRVVVGRAEHGTGADWYIAETSDALDEDGIPDLDGDTMWRLEVSGQDEGPIGARVTQKVNQLREGTSDFPGYAAVVGFGRAEVRIQSVEGGTG